MNVELLKEKFLKSTDERTLLSYCFKDTSNFYEISTKVADTDFLDSEHQMMFTLFKELINSGVSSIDMSVVISKAKSLGVLELVGGPKYIQSIANIQTSQDNLDVYIKSVLEASTKFKVCHNLNKHLEDIEKNAQTGKSSLDLINKVESDMLDMSSRSALSNDPILFGDSLCEFIEERKDRRISMTGLSTGYPILDKQIDGMIPGTLMIVGARKKMGKSTLLTNIGLYNAYKASVPILYIDTELTYSEWQTRSLAAISGIKERDIKHGGYNDYQLKRLQESTELIKTGKLFHQYMPGYSIDKIVSVCKKYKMKENIGLIIFDYLKEPDLSTSDPNRKEYQLLGDVTTKLKDLSGILNIPVLTAVQLNRQNDIADSDRIARFGDIISIWSTRTGDEKDEGGPDCGNYKLVIKDTRRGGSTSDKGIGFWFFKQWLTIKEVAPHQQIFMNVAEEVSNADDVEDNKYRSSFLDDDELA
jgi:replicative DNA helicase